MKSLLAWLLLLRLLGISSLSNAQSWEYGISIGPMLYHGDLAKPFIQIQATKPYLGAQALYNFNDRISVQMGAYAGSIAGADEYAPNTPSGMEHRKRNLSFHSTILEASSSLEVNFLKFTPGERSHLFSPFVNLGVGIFHFNPKTEFNGQDIELQPLATELNKPNYKLTQVCFPIGFGLKFNVKDYWILGVSYVTRFMLTDYLDDVSHNWQTQPTPGSLGEQLTYRGDEKDYGVQNLTNYQNPNDPTSVNRGNPKLKDNYMLIALTLSKRMYHSKCYRF